jgi:hypothetical protein
MRLADAAVVFKSSEEWFFREESGTKPNTVRWMSRREWDDLTEYDPAFVRIQLGDDADTNFRRPILSIYELGEVAGAVLVVISWRHP